jgi:hypothetical protein
VGANSGVDNWLHGEMAALAKRLLAHVENKTTDHAGDVFREPVANYTSVEKWERERQKLFRESPLLLGLSGDLPTNGSYRTLTVCDVPVLMIRAGTRALTTRGRTTARERWSVCRLPMPSRASTDVTMRCGNLLSKSVTECCGAS